MEYHKLRNAILTLNRQVKTLKADLESQKRENDNLKAHNRQLLRDQQESSIVFAKSMGQLKDNLDSIRLVVDEIVKGNAREEDDLLVESIVKECEDPANWDADKGIPSEALRPHV